MLGCKGICQNASICRCTPTFSELLHKYIAAIADGVVAYAVQMANKIATKKLPTASITLLGSGIMHWSKDKQIDVMQGMVHFVCLQAISSSDHLSHPPLPPPTKTPCCSSFTCSCTHCQLFVMLCLVRVYAPQCNAYVLAQYHGAAEILSPLVLLSAGVLALGGGNIRSKADVAHVAGSLIRSALPMHYHITVNGGRI